MADTRTILAPVGTSSTPSIASAATALAANSTRAAFLIQNLGTNPLFVYLGTGASTTVFSFILKAGTGNDDGIGGLYESKAGSMYTGIITIAGTNARYVATELTA
jgi:hypothetical protein